MAFALDKNDNNNSSKESKAHADEFGSISKSFRLCSKASIRALVE
ncbi:hypothetical protein Xkoz_00408 [Xenorhabdus kozodoii]|uniref:Uncharacterized protein n=1 Tax=Xenorhabdus kozodoii TaxID=351676 RepID=A0A2D0LHL0_9GAMM|nr:hypothetical protein Xkoz_00408 [Xenorhabdus kozodoii]